MHRSTRTPNEDVLMLESGKNYKRRTRAQHVRRRFTTIIIGILIFGGGMFYAYENFFAEKSGENIASAQAVQKSVTPSQPATSAQPSTSAQPASAAESTEKYNQIEIKKSESWKLILVNKKNALTKKSKPEKLSAVQGKIKMDARVNQAMKDMIAAAKADDISLIVCSGYRTYDYQETLFNKKKKYYLDKKMTEEQAILEAAKVVAKPGTSEHQTGLAADIVTKSYQALDEGFADTEAYEWLNEHAAEYGFILRYPKADTAITGVIYEPWHYRYVGVEMAKQIKSEKLCFESFLEKHKIILVD